MWKLSMLSLHQDPVLDTQVTSAPPFALALFCSSSLANVSGQYWYADIAVFLSTGFCRHSQHITKIKLENVFRFRVYEYVSLNCLAIIPGIFSSRSSVHLGQMIEMEAGWIKSLPTLRLRWWWDMLIRWVKCKQLTKAKTPQNEQNRSKHQDGQKQGSIECTFLQVQMPINALLTVFIITGMKATNTQYWTNAPTCSLAGFILKFCL